MQLMAKQFCVIFSESQDLTIKCCSEDFSQRKFLMTISVRKLILSCHISFYFAPLRKVWLEKSLCGCIMVVQMMEIMVAINATGDIQSSCGCWHVTLCRLRQNRWHYSFKCLCFTMNFQKSANQRCQKHRHFNTTNQIIQKAPPVTPWDFISSDDVPRSFE